MPMYFKNREEAGRQFADILFHPYGRSKSVILALSPGAVLVAKPIALRLQIPIFMVASQRIDLPGTFKENVGTLGQTGDFVYNSGLSSGEQDELFNEYHGHIESEKTKAMHDLNKMLGAQGFVERSQLSGKNILLVSDGMSRASDLDSIMSFLKPVSTMRIVGITPIASIDAIDRLHLATDEIRVIDPKSNYISTDHYYEENDIPSTEEVQEIIKDLNKTE